MFDQSINQYVLNIGTFMFFFNTVPNNKGIYYIRNVCHIFYRWLFWPKQGIHVNQQKFLIETGQLTVVFSSSAISLVVLTYKYSKTYLSCFGRNISTLFFPMEPIRQMSCCLRSDGKIYWFLFTLLIFKIIVFNNLLSMKRNHWVDVFCVM